MHTKFANIHITIGIKKKKTNVTDTKQKLHCFYFMMIMHHNNQKCYKIKPKVDSMTDVAATKNNDK